MAAARKNLLMDYRTSFNLDLRLKDSNRNPINLTGYTVTFGIFTPGKENNAPLLSKLAGVSSDGWITVRITDEENTLPVGKKAYRLDLENPAGDIERLLFGALEVRSGVAV